MRSVRWRPISPSASAPTKHCAAKEAAESANRELESFSYSVAHDLRGPLRSIDGFSQALEEDCADRLDDEGRKYLQFVRESAHDMAHLIDDLLALSRVTRSPLQPSPGDLSVLARRILERLGAGDAARHVEYTVENDVYGHGDPHLIAAVLENLLGNAGKFTSRVPAARIEFGMQPAATPAYFVRDNGAGFDMKYAEKLFGVFQRLHSADEFEGTGIGLATCSGSFIAIADASGPRARPDRERRSISHWTKAGTNENAGLRRHADGRDLLIQHRRRNNSVLKV